MTEIPTIALPPTAGLGNLLEAAGASGVPLAVAEADEMMQVFLRSHADLDRATLEYFRSGANMARTIGDLIAAAAPRPEHSVLDFGSGYGRVLRFLASRFGAARFWASDVYAGGIAFQEQRFGVHALLSNTDPALFVCDRRFRLIFSISVFTHLPAPTFHAWLKRLLDALEPGGLLAFTVHDEAVTNVGDTVPPEGILFLRQSESRSLDTADYGSTWVTERFLRDAAERAAPGAKMRRLPRAICDYQDLVLVAPPGSSLPQITPAVEPAFFLEGCRVSSPGRLSVRGWTFCRAGIEPADRVVEISAALAHDGETVDVVSIPPQARPDVPAALGGKVPDLCGFDIDLSLPEGVSQASLQLLVSVTLASGARFLSYAAPLASALLDGESRRLQFAEQHFHREHGRHVFREQHLERDIATLQAHVRAMEGTLTWKVRRRLRRLLGLSELPGK